MKSARMHVSCGFVAAALALPLSASAASIAPANVSFSAPGTITVSTPIASNVNCNVVFSGMVAEDGSHATINSVSVSGGGLCGVPQITGLPWKVVPTGSTTSQVTGAGFRVLLTQCGPSTIHGEWSNATNTLSASNQPLSGRCTIDKLSISPSPAFTLSP